MESRLERPRRRYVLTLCLTRSQHLIAHADESSITKSIVNHVQTSLARQAYNLDNLGAYQAVALSVRDDLIVSVAYDIIAGPALILHHRLTGTTPK